MLSKTFDQVESQSSSKGLESRLLHLLPLIALLVDFFSPILIAYGIVPSQMRWLTDLAVAIMLGFVILYVLAYDYIPTVLVVIVAMTLIWASIALLSGQGASATVWGWWQLFRYPFAGLFVYLYQGWPTGIAKALPRMMVAMLGVQVIVQLLQFSSGVGIGDNLSGTLGFHGVGILLVFVLLTISMALGSWLSYGNWSLLVWSLVLGAISSVLAENKLFGPALALLAIVTIIIFLIRGQQIRRIWIFIMMFIAAFLSFYGLYNSLAVKYGDAIPLADYLNNPEILNNYLNIDSWRWEAGSYDIGRNTILEHGWNAISADPTSLLFGLGMGARSESVSLGIVGQGLSNSYYGLISVSSLAVLMQEYGLVGLAFGLFVVIWLCMKLYRDALYKPQIYLNALRYGLMLFSLMWPLWLWYTEIWTMGAPMLLYWITIGYVFNKEIVSYFSKTDTG